MSSQAGLDGLKGLFQPGSFCGSLTGERCVFWFSVPGLFWEKITPKERAAIQKNIIDSFPYLQHKSLLHLFVSEQPIDTYS